MPEFFRGCLLQIMPEDLLLFLGALGVNEWPQAANALLKGVLHFGLQQKQVIGPHIRKNVWSIGLRGYDDMEVLWWFLDEIVRALDKLLQSLPLHLHTMMQVQLVELHHHAQAVGVGFYHAGAIAIAQTRGEPAPVVGDSPQVDGQGSAGKVARGCHLPAGSEGNVVGRWTLRRRR